MEFITKGNASELRICNKHLFNISLSIVDFKEVVNFSFTVVFIGLYWWLVTQIKERRILCAYENYFPGTNSIRF